MLKFNLILKRLIDFCGAFVGLVLLSPLLAFIGIRIKMDSPGPILFSQGRLTKDGRVFTMYKFRSMIVNAEQTGTGLFNYKDDPRVTKTGKFLRSTSLDELPQLWNVLVGDLSLVGPRPPVTYELGDFATLNAKYKKRFTMQGGITGLAQVKGRNENSWEEKVQFDNQYIDLFKQQGIWLDIKILWWTFSKVLEKENIYEEKVNSNLSDIESAKLAEEDVIRLAHLPDKE